jgi:hypothetical protein
LAINPDNKYVKRKRPDPNNDSVAGPILWSEYILKNKCCNDACAKHDDTKR